MTPEEFARNQLLEPITAYFITAFLFFCTFVVASAKNVTAVVWTVVVCLVFFIGVSLKWFLLGGALRATVRVITGIMVFSFVQIAVDTGVLFLLVYNIPKDFASHHLKPAIGVSILALSSLFLIDGTFALFMLHCLNQLRLIRRRIATSAPGEAESGLNGHEMSDGVQQWASDA